MIIRDGKATYKTDTSTFSFTFPTPEGEETITLTNGKLRKDIEFCRLYRYAYYYGNDSSNETREAFERHIYGLSAQGRADAKFLAKYAVEALNNVMPLSDFNAMRCRDIYADILCHDLANEISQYAELPYRYLNGDEPAVQTDRILVLESKPTHTRISCALIAPLGEGTFVIFSPIPFRDETAYYGQSIMCCEGKSSNPEKLTLTELIARYAANHKDGFTIVIPSRGDLDEVVSEIVKQNGHNAKIIPYCPDNLSSYEVYWFTVTGDNAFTKHYADHLEEAKRQLWDCLHDGGKDEMGNNYNDWVTYYDPLDINDEEMRQIVSQALSENSYYHFRDCHLLNGHDVLLFRFKALDYYPDDAYTLLSYATKSKTFIWV